MSGGVAADRGGVLREAAAGSRHRRRADRSVWNLVKQAGSDFWNDRAATLGAALAYYTAFSLAPLLVLALAIAGAIFGDEAARGEVSTQLQSFLGKDGAAGVEGMLEAANKPGSGTLATIVSIVVLLFGASGVFGELQQSLNTIWEVQPRADRGIWGTIRDRFLSFAMVLGVGFLLLVSLLLHAVLAAIGGMFAGVLPNEAVMHLANAAVSFLLVSTLFALMFKFLPDAHIAWRDVWVGAVITAVLFTIGKMLIGLYLGKASVASSYGAAGSVIVVLLWAYYSSQILLLGAEFTQAFAHMYGSRIVPAAGAEPASGRQP